MTTPVALRRLGTVGLREPVVGAAVATGTLALPWLLAGSAVTRRVTGMAVLPVLAALAAVGLWRLARDCRRVPAAARFWRICALAMAGYTAGLLANLVAFVHGLPGIRVPSPGTAYLYPVVGVLLLAGLVAFPTVVRTRVEYVKIFLDSAAALFGCAVFVWYFDVAPYWQRGEDWAALSTRLLLPALTLVAGFVVLRLALGGGRLVSRATVTCFAVSASASAIPNLFHIEYGDRAGWLCGTGGVVGLIAANVGIALQRRHGIGGRAGRTARRAPEWRPPFTVLPYAAVLATVAVFMAIVRGDLDWRSWVAVVGVLALCMVVLGRQFTALWENARLLTANRTLAERLGHQAFHDSLTGLANRALFTGKVGTALAAARQRPGSQVSVIFIDIDDFKFVNDSLGHQAGDELLVAVAGRLRGAVRAADTLGRLGGDEFGVLLTGDRDDTPTGDGVSDETVTAVAERLGTVLGEPFRLSGKQIHLRASLGIASAPDGSPDTDELLRNADIAMYAAKGGDKGAWRRFEPGMLADLLHRHQLAAALRQAIEREEFSVQYQPIVRLLDGRVCGAEALVRWRRTDGSWVRPDQFIPLAEETGIVAEIDRRVLRQACQQAVAWQAIAPPDEPFTIHVNLSARHLHRPELVAEVFDILGETGLPANLLTLEITESWFSTDPAGAAQRLAELSKLGLHLAVDDFGTGYSSLSRLRHMPVHVLKIDKSFTDELADELGPAPLAHAVIALAKTLNMQTVAEGIEHPVQARRLLALGCRYGQGFHFARPMPAPELTEFLTG